MKKTIEDVVKFIKLAMQKNLVIQEFDNTIDVEIDDTSIFRFECNGNELIINELYYNITLDCEPLSERDIITWNSLILDVKEYQKSKVLEDFDKFFKIESEDIKTLDDFSD